MTNAITQLLGTLQHVSVIVRAFETALT